MKIGLYFSLVASLLFVSCKDACKEVSCSFGESCEDGVCDCEIENYAYLDWFLNCAACQNISTTVFSLDIDGVKIASITLKNQTYGSRRNLKIQKSGTFSYKVYANNDTSNVIESGNVSLIRCDINTLSTTAL